MDNTIQNIIPDAKGLFYALRNMGYSNTAAIEDLIDNSVDAGATDIWVTIDNDKIYIADNGSGMDLSTLKSAITLGGKKAHDAGTDLGKYGVGLVMASISMGRTIRIITKKDDEYYTAVMDCDKIYETNTFIADFCESTESEKDNLDYRIKNSDTGTVLIIDNCDKLQYAKPKDLIDNLSKSLSQVFRVFLQNGKHIYLNNESIEAIDPLYRNIPGTQTLVDKDIIISDQYNSYPMHITAVKIKDQGAKINKGLKLNIMGQGFYVLRNKREIASALEFQDVFQKHNDFNLFRIELSFGPELDDLMHVNLKKRDINPSKEVISELRIALSDTIKKLRQEMKEKQKNPINPFIKPGNSTTNTPATPTNAPIITAPQPTTATPTITIPMPAPKKEYEIVFGTYAGSEDGPIFKVSLTGQTVTVRSNIYSDFYKKLSNTEIRVFYENIINANIKAYLEVTGTVTSLELFMNTLASKISKKD